MTGLAVDPAARRELWSAVLEAVSRRLEGRAGGVLDPRPAPGEVRRFLEQVDFDRPVAPQEAVALVVEGLERFQVHVDDPAYMGRFNPAPSEMGVVADTLVAAFNPQLAAWIYSAFPVEVEQLLLRSFGEKLGLPADGLEGTFASGSAEANHTGLLVALTHGTSGFPDRGLAEIPERPVVYVSAEGHHSVLKAARTTGLGNNGVVAVPVDERFRLRPGALQARIAADREAGRTPLVVVATAGTTGSGAIDPIDALADLTTDEDLWLHVDAAWGGPLALLEERRGLLAGIERADSVALDAHKLLSVPMGCGMFLTRHPGLLRRTFSVRTGYMPAAARDAVDPYEASIQWSRRFIGLKLFMTLLVAGWEGYAEVIRRQMALCDRLAEGLAARGWRVVNDPAAGVLCFVDGTGHVPDDELPELADRIVASGDAWVGHARIGRNGQRPAGGPAPARRDGPQDAGRPGGARAAVGRGAGAPRGPGRTVLRACITNHRTRQEHVDRLLESLGRQRAAG